MKYRISHGNEKGYFHLKDKGGVVTVHFSRRLTQPRTFDLVIVGKPKRRVADYVLPSNYFRLSLRIVVVN
jgi:hypothetical protein